MNKSRSRRIINLIMATLFMVMMFYLVYTRSSDVRTVPEPLVQENDIELRQSRQGKDTSDTASTRSTLLIDLAEKLAPLFSIGKLSNIHF